MAGRTYPTVLSVADEVAVAAFLEGKIRFTEIPAVVSAALDKHQPVAVSLETISEVTKWARVAGHNAIAELA